MVLDNIPLFSMLKGRLGYLTEREKLVAQNVANTDTPGYRPTQEDIMEFQKQLAGLVRKQGL